MRIMTKKQEGRLDKLVKLAGGDFSLVEEALRNASPESAAPNMEEVVRYIIKKREAEHPQEHVAAAG